MIREKIYDDIYFNSYIEEKFKNNMLVVKFILPLNEETVSKYAMIPHLLTMRSKDYESIIKINKRLDELYGSNMIVDVKKVGVFQVISIGINFIDKRYIDENLDISESCCKLLLSIIKKPYFVNRSFSDKSVSIVKKLLSDKIDGRLSNKNLYAMDRCKEIMFRNETLRINEYGCKDEINSLNKRDITLAYYEMLNKSKIEIIYIGSSDQDKIKELCKKILRRNDELCNFKINFEESKVKDEIANVAPNEQLARNFVVMNILFGNSPTSKLFVNIREKMNLCYYCNSVYDRYSNTVIVSMGIDGEKKEDATKETINQLKELQEGNFTDKDLENVKLLIKNIYMKTKDSISGMVDRCFNQSIFGQIRSIDDEIDLINKVSKDDVVNVAKILKLDTIYLLKGCNRVYGSF